MLTKEQILEKCHSANLDDVRNINLWGCDLENIDIIAQLPNIEMVSLSCNNISSLKSFSSCPRLRELYLRKNKISDPNEFNHLSNCKDLKILWLEENPICSREDYRSLVLTALPQLVKLDNVNIAESSPSGQSGNEAIQPLSTLESISNANETKRKLRNTHSAIPKLNSQPQMTSKGEEDYIKKLDNIDDIKNYFSNVICPNGNANSNNANVNNINILPNITNGINNTNSNNITNNTLSSNNSTNKKDYLVSETLLNAQQMKFTSDNIQGPVKVFNYDANINQVNSNINNPNISNEVLNQRNNQYGHNDLNINYHNFKQVPLKNNQQPMHYDVNNTPQYHKSNRESRHNVDPIPISDSLSNISPRNYHLMTAILNLMEDLSVKELLYVRNKIVNILGDSN